MIRENPRFPDYLVKTLRQYGGSVYIRNINLSHYEAKFAQQVNQTSESELNNLETAFKNLSYYLRLLSDASERAYYLRLLAVIAGKICELREVEYVISAQTEEIFTRSGTLITDSNLRRVGVSLRL